MAFSRLLEESEYDQTLAERKRKLGLLKTYPTAERAFTGFAKIFMALLLGGSNVVTLVLLGTAVSAPVSIGFLAGAVIYAAKAARDVYKKRKHEKELTDALNANFIKLEMLFNQQFIDQLNQSMQLLRDGYLNAERSELLYTHLHELRDVFDKYLPDPKQNNLYLAAIHDSSRALNDKICIHKGLNPGDVCPPDEDQGVIAFPRQMEKPRLFSAARYFKKFGNRLLSFLAGASSAIGIGLGIASVAFGMASPAGLALMVILGSAALIGLMAVTVDYYLTRREDKKIMELERKNRELVVLQQGVKTVKTVFKRMNDNVEQSLEHQRKEAEYEQQRRALLGESVKSGETIVALEKSLESRRLEISQLKAQVDDLKGREVVYLPRGTLFRNNTQVVIPHPEFKKKGKKPKMPRGEAGAPSAPTSPARVASSGSKVKVT